MIESDTPRVDAVIAETMARHPGESPARQAAYFEAVHQALAPLARKLERENAMLMDWCRSNGLESPNPAFQHGAGN